MAASAVLTVFKIHLIEVLVQVHNFFILVGRRSVVLTLLSFTDTRSHVADLSGMLLR